MIVQETASNVAPSEALMSTGLALEVVDVERIDGTEIVVEFSDSTWARYTSEELATMRPERQKVDSSDNGDDVPK